MQRDECFLSRGNVAVAALLLVSVIGVAAVALDSVRGQNVRSQVAAADASGTGGGGTADAKSTKTKCEIGFDYNVRVKDGKTIVEKHGDNKCKSTVTGGTVLTSDKAVDGRICKKEEWKCYIWICKIDGLRLKVDGKFKDRPGEVDGCTQVPPSKKQLKVGEEIDVDSNEVQGELNQQSGAALKDILKNGTLEDKKAAILASQSLDPTYRNQILGAFEQETKDAREEQLDKLTGAKTTLQEAQDALEKCKKSGWQWAGCGSYEQAVKDAQTNVSEQEKKLKALADQSQALAGARKELEAGCRSNCPDKPGAKLPLDQSGTPRPPTTFGGGDPPGGSPGPSSSGGAGDFMKTLGQFAPLIGSLLNNFLNQQKPPTCTLTASPKNISKAGDPVTISWTSQNAQSAYLSVSGQVGPVGTLTVNPQQTTTYTMQVIGYPPQQQQANPYAQAQPQGQYVWNPSLNAYVYIQQPQGTNPYGQPQQQGGTPQQGRCTIQVTVGAQTGTGSGTNTGNSDKPKAQISCQPKIADVGMSVAISYACQNASTAGAKGFSNNGELSGSANAKVESPTIGSTSVTYSLTCSKDGQIDSAECTVNVNKPSIVLVGNPKNIKKGETSNIGWVTGAMESCVVSSPDLSVFTEQNKNNTSASGSAKTPALTQNAKFVLNCTTKAGGTKSAETTVEIGN